MHIRNSGHFNKRDQDEQLLVKYKSSDRVKYDGKEKGSIFSGLTERL